MKKNVFKNLMLALTAISVFFGSLECVQRIRYWNRYDSSYWLLYGFRGKLPPEEYYRMQLKGLYGIKKGAVVMIPRIFYSGYSKFDPAYPHEGYRINSLGFRGREFTRQKPPGTYRIAVVGDSTVFGLGCDDDSTFPHFLENDLASYRRGARVEVLNLGIPSYTTANMKNLIKAEVLDYSPDMIIIYGFFNDVYYSPVVFRKGAYLLALINGFLMDRSVFYLSLREKMCKFFGEDIGMLYRGPRGAIIDSLAKDGSIIHSMRENLGEGINAARERGIDTVLGAQALYISDRKTKIGSILQSGSLKPFYERVYAEIDSLGKAESVRVIAANDVFENLGDSEKDKVFLDSTHLSADGNRLLAGIFFEGIKDLLMGKTDE
jgi:lysophospholipase L1-like esterase